MWWFVLHELAASVLEFLVTHHHSLPASQCIVIRDFSGVQMLTSDAGLQSLGYSLALAIVFRCDLPDHAAVQKQSVSRSECLFQCEISRFLSNLQLLLRSLLFHRHIKATAAAERTP